MRFLLKALLAATALIPAATAASAQDDGRRWDRNGRADGGDRAERVAARQAERAQRQPDGGGGNWNREQRAAPAAQIGQAPVQDQGRSSGRRDRNDGRVQVQDGAGTEVRQRPAQDGRQWAGRRDGNGARAQVQVDGGSRFRPLPDANQRQWNGRRDDRSARGNDARQPQQPFRNDRGADDWSSGRQPPQTIRDDRRVGDWNRGRNDQWRGNDWRNGNAIGNRGYNDNRGWNRTWRNDNRYDWNRYRTGNRNAYRLPRYYAPYGWSGGYRRFSVGVTLNSILWDENYWIQDPYTYRLPEAYGPYRWVRYYNDALLVDVRYGQVIDTVNNIFW